MGHHIRQCPDRRVSLRAGKEPGLCKRCWREKLWTSKHRPKRNDQGNLLLKNGHKGKLQVIDKFWGNPATCSPTRKPIQEVCMAVPGSTGLNLSCSIYMVLTPKMGMQALPTGVF